MSDGYGSDGYGYDPYGGRQPQIAGYDEYGRPVYAQDGGGEQGYGQQPYDTGSRDAGGHDAGSHDSGSYGTGRHTAGGYDTGSYDTGSYGTGSYGTGSHDAGGYDTGSYDTAAFDAYDPYGAQTGSLPPVTDPYAAQQAAAQYATGRYPAAQQGAAGPRADAYAHGAQSAHDAYSGYDPYGPAADTGAGLGTGTVPGPDAGPSARAAHDTGTIPAQASPPDETPAAAGTPRRDSGDDASGGYDTEQFSFVEEDSEQSEDVIDWLKFTESRTERREEAKRRGRNRKRALVILLVLALLGGVGYLWYTGRLPGLGGGPGSGTSAAGQQRDVLVVHLRTPDSDASSTALLVDNATTEQGTTLLLPNSLAVSTSDGSTTTLGKSVESEGATPTRDALNRLLGADIKGTWRLDTPYLEILVDTVGGITLDADTTVPGEKEDDEPLVKKGEDRELDGRAAVAYATHRGDAEPKSAQLERFGQVMHAVLTEMSTDEDAATETVESLGQILDPSLSQASLGASLASLAERAQQDAYRTTLLPVQPDGTLSAETSDGVVKEVLGGTVQNSDPDAAPRVSLRNAAGDEGADDAARVTLVNGGFTVVGAAEADGTRETSKVVYEDPRQKERAEAVAKTLGLGEDAVAKGDGANNADVTVVLGTDYES